MGFRSILAAALAALCLAAPPALAATTDQKEFEKRVARFARPAGNVGLPKARGVCTCTEDGVGVSAGQAGLLFYSPASLMGEFFITITCVIPLFDADGALLSSAVCDGWTLLGR